MQFRRKEDNNDIFPDKLNNIETNRSDKSQIDNNNIQKDKIEKKIIEKTKNSPKSKLKQGDFDISNKVIIKALSLRNAII